MKSTEPEETIDSGRIDDAVLALMWLGVHDEFGRTWKGFDWDAMDRLQAAGLISDPRGRAKSVVLSEEGLARSKALFERMFAKGGAD